MSASYRVHGEWAVVDDVKRALCVVHETGYDDAVTAGGAGGFDSKSYELPDGTVIKLGATRFAVPELLFRSGDPLAMDATGTGSGLGTGFSLKSLVAGRNTTAWMALLQAGVIWRRDGPGKPHGSPLPLHMMVHSALQGCGPEVRRDLCNNVIVTGGGSLLPDLHKRLHWELCALIPAAFKPRVISPLAVEKEFAPWIGGSILASLGTFQQMWVSRAEYEEEGAAAVDRKCAM